MIPFKLSTNLSHTWFIDLDGTILKHNGYLNGGDELLPGVKEFWSEIPPGDFIIITTGRKEIYRKSSLKFLDDNGLRYNLAIFELPLGERITINDLKPEGLKTAISWNIERNKGFLL
jgi:hydroxymethylpyrimidine pyrophosphatase-like HAD family hydrolase